MKFIILINVKMPTVVGFVIVWLDSLCPSHQFFNRSWVEQVLSRG